MALLLGKAPRKCLLSKHGAGQELHHQAATSPTSRDGVSSSQLWGWWHHLHPWKTTEKKSHRHKRDRDKKKRKKGKKRRVILM